MPNQVTCTTAHSGVCSATVTLCSGSSSFFETNLFVPMGNYTFSIWGITAYSPSDPRAQVTIRSLFARSHSNRWSSGTAATPPGTREARAVAGAQRLAHPLAQLGGSSPGSAPSSTAAHVARGSRLPRGA